MDDFYILKQTNWCINKCQNRKTNKEPHFYAGCNTYKGIKKSLLMHRLITNAQKGDIVDHFNEDSCDNRKQNLVICTQKENIAKSKKYFNNTSGTTGVCWVKHIEKWKAYIKIDYKLINIGFYNNIEDAIKARKQAEEKYRSA